MGVFYISVKESENRDLNGNFSILILMEFQDGKRIENIRMIEVNGLHPDKISFFVKNNVKPNESSIMYDDSLDIRRISKDKYELKPKAREHGNNFLPVLKVIDYLEKQKLLNNKACYTISSNENLSKYLNECCFKFNYRYFKNSQFDIILQNALKTKIDKAPYS